MIGTLVRPARPESTAGPVAAPVRHRPDIQGLRAVAVLLVVLSHAGVPGLAGGYVGVDVFFVISGFLITGLLLRERLSSGRLALARFYARRAVRLLPASTLVATVTLAASWRWLPPARIAGVAYDALSAAGYAVNVRLAAVATDYFADPAPSPFQHFWSLAVEEQFYLGWPLLIVLVLLLRRRLRALAGVLGSLVVLSLAYSAFEVTVNVPAAYFGLPSRAWELGVGALVALWPTRGGPLWITSGGSQVGAVDSAPPETGWGRSEGYHHGLMIKSALGWIGLAAILVAAVVLDDDSVFPGLAALPPVLGAAAVLATGRAASASGAPVTGKPGSASVVLPAGRPGSASAVGAARGWGAAAAGGSARLLGLRPLTRIGDYSYSLYLWHWPLLILAPAAVGHDLGLAARLGLCAAALVLAALTYHLVENPVRRRRWLTERPIRGLATGLGLSGATAGLAALALAFPPAVPTGGIAPDTRAALRTARNPAAELGHLIDTAEGVRRVPGNLVPTLTAVPDEELPPQTDGCHQTLESAVGQPACTYGRADAARTVVVVGDSHALQWFPAFEDLAEQNDWRLVSLTRSSCLPADLAIRNARMKRRYTECEGWRRWALGRIDALRPDLVVVATDTNYPGMLVGNPADPDRLWAHAWDGLFARLGAAARHVVLLADTPTLSADPLDCLGSHDRDITACTEPATTVLRDPAWRAEVLDAARRGRVPVVDPTPWLCGRDCPLVVGNVLVYRDTNHLTPAYAGMLSPLLGASLPHLP